MPARKKHPSVRRRTNRASTAAVLGKVPEDQVEVPVLPQRFNADGEPINWRRETLDWWADVWASPMSNEYIDADIHGLFRLAALVDNYWRAPSAKAHAEVRMAQRDYGLTPYDRRRLEWTIEAAEDAKDKGAKRRGQGESSEQPEPGVDPRLKLVQ